jgi:anhydro-N-acetylmuramic acid kinase
MTKARDAWLRLRDYPERSEHWIVGLMSGTSADAVDAALVRFSGRGEDLRFELAAYQESPLGELRAEVHEVAGSETVSLERLMALDVALGQRYAAAVRALLDSAGIKTEKVDAIGCHGQTVRHRPRSESQALTLTLQIGSDAILAEETGLPVVSDFRSRDAAAGGQAAPLVPLADAWLFRSSDETRVLLNLGGMANVTLLQRGGTGKDVIAFDTGPGNAVIDGVAQLTSEGERQMDVGGGLAATGTASSALLAELLADPFFATPPPRSTGREHFGDRYAAKLMELGIHMGLSDVDILATAVELTAASVADAVSRFLKPRGPVDAVYASGGGVHNATLMRALARTLAPAKLDSLAALGVPPEAKEALAFAFLAHRTLCGESGNLPSATGARHDVVLGRVTPGATR